MQNRVYFFDTTLRDGEQSPGATMNLQEKLRLAHQLEVLGVDIMEAGFPASSPGDFESVRTIAAQAGDIQVAGLARCVDSDIDRCWEAVKCARNPRIHTFLSTSPLHMKHKLRKDPEDVLKMAVAGVKRCASYTDNVEFSAEDFSRSEKDFLCRIVIHDVRHGIENTILYIENGHVTDRKSGDSASNVVLEAIKADPSTLQDQYAYLTKTNDGRLLKSSTFYIKDESGTLAYIFSINYDITALAAADQFLQSFIQTQNPAEPSASRSATPQITHNVIELLDTLIEQAISNIGKPAALMTKDEKVRVVQYLNDAGAFLITKSGDKVASILGISKFTLYNYMDAGK